MLSLLVVLMLLELVVCMVVPVPVAPAVVTAGTVAAIAPARFAYSDSAVAARSAGDAARWDQGEDAGCAGGGAGRVVADLPNATILQVVPAAFQSF